MFITIIKCKLCSYEHSFEKETLWHTISIINSLEIEIREGRGKCDACKQLSAVHITVKSKAIINAVIFEKFISPIVNKGTYTKSNTNKYKPTMDEPCLPCCATGKMEVQYKAHKSDEHFKGVLMEECPICNGKGYLK